MNNQEQVWKVGKWVGVLLVVFLAVISVRELVGLNYVGIDMLIMHTITVQRRGEAISLPDIATFSFTVTENAKTVEEAQTKATAKIDAALAAVKASGVEEKDIETLSYNINPHYDYQQGICTPYGGCPNGKQVLNGYDVSQTIQVKVRDLSKAGELFSSVGATGIQNINGLTFGIDDLDSVKAEARADAIAQAKEKAEKIAEELDVKLVRIMSFYDSSDDMYYYAERSAIGMGGDAMNVKTQAAPQVPVGEQKVTATVNITYEIR